MFLFIEGIFPNACRKLADCANPLQAKLEFRKEAVTMKYIINLVGLRVIMLVGKAQFPLERHDTQRIALARDLATSSGSN